jgi:hypothetical protein
MSAKKGIPFTFDVEVIEAVSGHNLRTKVQEGIPGDVQGSADVVVLPAGEVRSHLSQIKPFLV